MLKHNLLLLSSDLSVASRLSDEARRHGGALAWDPSLAALLAREEAQGAALAVIDLATAGLEIAAAVAAFRAMLSNPAVVAFGPHVHEGRLVAAREAGCDAVLSRGQFHAQLGPLVGRWLTGGPQETSSA